MNRPMEYRDKAIACRALAQKLGPDDNEAHTLKKMAQTWDRLALSVDKRYGAPTYGS